MTKAKASHSATPVYNVGAAIIGTGLAVPKHTLTNADLEKKVDTSDQWIVQRTGINQRYICNDETKTSDLASEAVTMALGNAGIKPSDLGLLICATMTPDMACPAAACQVVNNIGAVPCGAFDVNLACTGFVAAMSIANSFIRSGMYRNIAVVGAEQLSRMINWKDRNTCVLFGDGAGAAIVSATDNPLQGCCHQAINSDASRWQELYCPRNEAGVPDGAVFNGQCDTLQMNGREIFKFAVNTFTDMIQHAMDECGLSPSDVKAIIPHQSNIRILRSAAGKLGFDDDKIYINIDRYGNTSAASVGICLHELMADKRLKKGDTVIFVGLGGGLSWATSVWKL